MMDTPEEIVAAMKERFGEKDTSGYLTLMRAMRSLMFVWEAYIAAPENSFEEAVTGLEVEKMTDALEKHPRHATELVEGFVALVIHMRKGGSYEEWFETVGISPTPEEPT